MTGVFKFAQTQLKEKNLYRGNIDGILGPNTENAVDSFKSWPGFWNTERKVVGFVQTILTNNNINVGVIDGRWGPKTESGYNKFISNDKVFELDPIPTSNKWPKESTYSLINYYGNVGTNQTLVTLPYPMKLAWDKSKSLNRISFNRKCAPALQQWLEKALNHYGIDEIIRLKLNLFGGSLNVRKIRGGNRYSTHSWGIAMDLDPDNNRLKWGRKYGIHPASFEKSVYNKFWEFGEEVGAYNLGRKHGYDWMHTQFCHR